ncbi:MAG: 23S rRNA (cytidine(2498)-2'-O)-methyltransferase RlmM [Rhodocyclaceae bacterium]|nr:23S rRNA (cytidine(2498)-2'-O)-methyltransferase RlmM [Rhodocyclaceae bacterium]MBX3669771.1 23S rRNA (cytidine(2498)-2'-O)-methyltransferase RlmM [Rhodocyclaceae bacterium]
MPRTDTPPAPPRTRGNALPPAARGLLLYCREGFEKECAQDLSHILEANGWSGYCVARPMSALVEWIAHDGSIPATRLPALSELVFARQLLLMGERLTDLAPGQRVEALLAAAKALAPAFSGIVVETAYTDAARELSALAKSLAPALTRAAKASGMLQTEAGLPRLHVLIENGSAALVAAAVPGNCSDWHMGVPRLKMPAAAPSRATLKLHEAFLTLLTEAEREQLLQPGMTAVDLGAAPGGWTWQLVRRHLRVTAVDNAAIAPELLDSGLVRHQREDGFRFRPPKTVDWMVCDMVEQPSRIAKLAAQWLAAGWCRHTIFNLKLPMRRRYEEVERCRALIADALGGAPHELRIKQLFHDREEVSAYLAPAPPVKTRGGRKNPL